MDKKPLLQNIFYIAWRGQIKCSKQEMESSQKGNGIIPCTSMPSDQIAFTNCTCSPPGVQYLF